MVKTPRLIAACFSLFAVSLAVPACSSSSSDTPACQNGTKDDGEEGVDCGGTCSAKCTGVTCAVDTECVSGHCNAGACAAPADKTCGVGAAIPTCNDGEKCELDKDCTSGFCDGTSCAEPPAGSHSDGKKNGGETGIDCGGSVKDTQPCPDGQGCFDNTDCVGTCTMMVCGPIGPMDGKKDNGETDVDCGGANAPKCADGKTCTMNSDCAEDYCPDATHLCTAPTYTDGVQNGTETDVDCGGSGMGMVKCAETKNCLVDGDCNGACNYQKKCVDAPSCKNQMGGDTCGGGDEGNGDDLTHMTAAGPAAGHESCCRTLPVTGYTDSKNPGKTVYLDKYEITAGRMRAFLQALGGGVDAAGNAMPANVKAWIEAHVPALWNAEWNNTLPQSNAGINATYTISSSPVDYYYFDNTTYQKYPKPGAQSWTVQSGTYNFDFGVFTSLGGPHLYPEMINGPDPFGGNSQDYGASHALNCQNGPGSYGYSTYWFDNATVEAYGAADPGKGKFFTKDQLDVKSLTCSPFGLMAAFCAWDGGQLATAEVVDYITSNTVSPVYSNANQNGKYTPSSGASGLGQCTGGVISYSDGAANVCYPYFYPNDMGNDWDGSSRIAPPGRIAADVMTKNAGDEPWMDMIGNLHEAVFASTSQVQALVPGDTTQMFDFRGYGAEYTSILYHRAQYTTPRGKGGSMGGRCMRFK